MTPTLPIQPLGLTHKVTQHPVPLTSKQRKRNNHKSTIIQYNHHCLSSIAPVPPPPSSRLTRSHPIHAPSQLLPGFCLPAWQLSCTMLHSSSPRFSNTIHPILKIETTIGNPKMFREKSDEEKTGKKSKIIQEEIQTNSDTTLRSSSPRSSNTNRPIQ